MISFIKIFFDIICYYLVIMINYDKLSIYCIYRYSIVFISIEYSLNETNIIINYNIRIYSTVR